MVDDNEDMLVTPWEVRGKIDYDRLIKEFGTQRITPELDYKRQTHHARAGLLLLTSRP